MENTFGKNIIPDNDVERVEALKRYKIINTPPEHCFDHIAGLATQIFNVPVSLISLVDAEQVYFKANVGMGKATTSPRGVSICSLAVLDPEVTVFENAPHEPCLLTNPNVAGSFGLKFYAGAPLTTADGFRIGTLCIIDKIPRKFDANSRAILKSMAKIVMDEIELRLSSISEVELQHQLMEETTASNEELLASNEELIRSQIEVGKLNAELSETNSEIRAANEELLSVNHALKVTQNSLLLVNAKLAESENLKNMAIEQADLGIWYIDADTRAFIPSPRLKQFFGYHEDETMPYEAAVSQIREDYSAKVVEKINEAFLNNESYDLEYPIIEFRSKRQRWVKSTGKLNPAEKGRKSYFSGTVLDITEQKENEQRKNDFISMVSHELKTPLTSMGGYIQVLQMRADKNKDGMSGNILSRAYIQTKKMSTMIDGFLNMKRADTGKIPIDLKLFDMADLIKEAEVESLATISSHNIIFAPVETTPVVADKDKVGQVITNLINNAVKYSPLGSTINVACIRVNETAQVSVKDEGMGVLPTDQDKLFDRFFRVDSKQMANISGFGIGLYLCDEIIRGHGGKIWVESELGVGSTFYFSLPL
ncbi:ATP-binding protein [Pedobacter sp. Leaf216]|uniref:ATP-binding protein n=1 Tax=Pedobacter sp. Leaf216 TaxID=1735684 RepID=UPI0009E9919E|nr:ATP-binding protein [Pedobacter sp. Leaf216]